MLLKYVDSSHAYFLNGKRCKSVTSVAKIPEDTYRLEQWQQRQVAIGLAMKPSLLESIAANVDNNQKINALCEQAQAEAGAHEGRDRGDTLHKALEQHDAGNRFIPTDLTSSAIKTWEDILDAQQWEVELIERCVIWPAERIAGRFDRLVRGPMCATCEGRLSVIDFKSGSKVQNYPHAIACQLALYANAPLIAGPIPGDGGETEDITELHDVCTCRAFVVHLPPDSDAQLIEINIEFALPVIKNIIFPTIAWRAHPAKSLAKVIDLPLRRLAPTEDIDPFAGLPGADPAPTLERPDNVFQNALAEVRQANIKERLETLKKDYPQAAQWVAGRWPEGVPSLKSNIPLTQVDMDKIEAVLIDAERLVEAPFNPIAPEEQPPKTAHADPPPVDPPARTIDEGPDMDPADIEAMRNELGRLDKELFDRITGWVIQANEAGTSISLRTKPSKRRFSVARFMLVAVHHDEDVVRAVLSLAIGEEVQPAFPTGAVLGSLSQAEAEKAWEIVLGIDGAAPVWRYDDLTRRLVAA